MVNLLNLKWLDILDILLITFVLYQLFSFFYKTRGFRILIGLSGLGIMYLLVRSWGLFLSTLLLQVFWQALIILIIIVFQPEIREVLEKLNLLNLFHGKKSLSSGLSTIETIRRSVFRLARDKIGAIIVLQQEDDLKDLLRDSLPYEAKISEPVFLSIFQKNSPIHDGAILVEGDRIKTVAGYLPMTEKDNLPNHYGSRHRASLGLSEKSDALIIVVSEERGEVSIVHHGRIKPIQYPGELSDYILESFSKGRKKEKTSFQKTFSRLILAHWPRKLVTFIFVLLFYLAIAGQQNYSQNLLVPIEYKNIPAKTELVSPPKIVKIFIKGTRKTIASLKPDEVRVELDVSLAQWGRRTFNLSEGNINLPSEIQLLYIEPSTLRLEFR